MNLYFKKRLTTVYIFTLLILSGLCACSKDKAASDIGSFEVKQAVSTPAGTSVLTPTAPKQKSDGNDFFNVDYSNSGDGYIVVCYIGSGDKIKLQLTGPNNITYTYNLKTGKEAVIPLSTGSGSYTLTLYEGINSDQYATSFSTVINANILNEFSPFLYPNQYVDFNKGSKAVSKARELAGSASCELEIIANVYSFIAENISYDYDEAKTVESDYLPDVDEVLDTKKGICFDYAALMASMLRSQGIPAKLEIGYAKDAYHAWISVYTRDVGWIDKIMQFDGKTWTLMDPTLAANSKDNRSKIKEFIGDGSSYSVKYTY